jgi:TPR repeat protein
MISAVLTIPANGGQLDDGIDAFGRGDYGAAIHLWRPLAEQGNREAQFRLGIIYEQGLGVTKDDAEALLWYRRAAEQGNETAQFALGSAYEAGSGVPLNYQEAARWYRKAADQGSIGGQVNLSSMYAGGRGVPEDFVTAYMWITLALSAMQPGYPGYDIANNIHGALRQRMTPQQIAQAQDLARQWKARPQGQ